MTSCSGILKPVVAGFLTECQYAVGHQARREDTEQDQAEAVGAEQHFNVERFLDGLVGYGTNGRHGAFHNHFFPDLS